VPVDLNQLAKKTSGVVEPGGTGVAVLDRCALRKDWTRSGQATYWVDLLVDGEGQMQVWCLWRWCDKKGATPEWKEGSHPRGHATKNDRVVAELFVATVNMQIQQKGYVMDERQTSPRSPAAGMKIEPSAVLPPVPQATQAPMPVKAWVQSKPEAMVAQDPAPATPPKPVNPLNRKGDKDWW
jgi:hypothetical protein